MLMSRVGLIAAFVLISPVAFAQDVTVYGGRLFNDPGRDLTTITASVGFDSPKALSAFKIDQLRADFTYGWRQESFSGSLLSAPLAMPPAMSNGPVDRLTLSADQYYFHLGPSWRVKNILGPVDLSVGIQAGVAHGIAKSKTDPVAGNEFFNRKTSDTNFSYQFPVELETPLFNGVSFSVRYRPVGVFDGGENGFYHIVEGGIRVRF